MTRFTLAAILAVLLAFPVASARAELQVNVNQGQSQPIPIAVTNFVPNDPSGAEFATGIPEVITNNLVGSTLR